MAIILANEDLIGIIFVAKCVVNDEISLDYRHLSYVPWYTLSNLTIRLTLNAL